MWSNVRHPSLLLSRLVKSSRPVMSTAKLVPGVLDYAYRATIKTVVFVLGLVLLVATVKAIFGDHIVIEAISVPRQLEEDGYSGVVVSRRLLGQLQVIGQSGNELYVTQSAGQPLERVRFRSEDDFSSLSKVQVPSSGLSLRSMAQALRQFLGFPESKISGEITIKRPTDGKAPLAYTIVLRFSSPASQTAESAEADNIDEAIRLSAPSIAERFDPVGLAAHHFKNKNWTEMTRLTDSLIAHVDPELRKQGLLLRGAHEFVSGRNDEAINFFRQVIKEDRRFGEAYNAWGTALANMGDYDNAIEKYQQAIELNPFNYSAYLNRGGAYRAKGESDRAMKDFERAVELGPNVAVAFVNRGVVFLDKGETDLALQDFGRAIKLDPNLAIAFHDRGLAYFAKGETDRAMQDFDQAIKLDPRSAYTFLGRANAYTAKGERDRAIQDYDQALQLDPKNAIALNSRCYSKAIVGHLDSALADCNESLRLRPNAADTLDSRGFAYLKLGSFDLAIADYDAVLKLEPRKVLSLFGRGVAKRRTGDVAGGDADIANAERIQADIASEMAKLGVQP